MDRDDLKLLLTDLITRGRISEADAARVLALFDSGEFVPSDLPAQEDSGNEWLLGLVAVLLLTGGNTTTKLSAARRRQARNTLRSGFEADTLRLARGVTGAPGGGAGHPLNVTAWQQQTWSSLVAYTRQMAIAGAGTLPTASTLAMVEAHLAEQWPYLQRFASELMARQATGKALSEAAINARARLYGGTGWGSFYLAQGQDAGAGVVDVWYTRDDRFVCPRCAPRHRQYFLPGQGPYPGFDCLGSCRCERRQEYNAEIWQELTGRRAA